MDEDNGVRVPEIYVPSGQAPGAPQAPDAQQGRYEPQPVGFWVRGGALMLDVLIVVAPVAIVAAALGLMKDSWMGKLVFGAVFIAYQTLMVANEGQTLGKMAAGATVVGPGGGPVAHGAALTRAVVNLVAGNFLVIGYLVAVFNPGRRALHDYAAGTSVVYLKPVNTGRKTVMALLGAALPILLVLGLAAAVVIPMMALKAKQAAEAGGAASRSAAESASQRAGGAGEALGGLNSVAAKLQELTGKCEGGDAEACGNLGMLYHNGQAVQKDLVRAAELLSRSCEGGNAGGCYNLGGMAAHGEGMAEDPAKAVSLYERACGAGAADACNNLGIMHVTGNGVAKDAPRALEFFRKGCSLGNAMGCQNASKLEASGLAAGKAAAPAGAAAAPSGNSAAALQRACGDGDAKACSRLGTMYYKGSGVGKDLVRAEELYEQSCDGGEAAACAYAGYMYSVGAGVKKSASAARRFYSQACEGGYTKACAKAGGAGR